MSLWPKVREELEQHRQQTFRHAGVYTVVFRQADAGAAADSGICIIRITSRAGATAGPRRR